MQTYPIMLKLQGKPVVVIGGGSVGARKASGLLRAGASVTIVDPRVRSDRIPPGAKLLAEAYREEHLEDVVLVIACTNDRQLNARIASDARRRGLWINVADEPEHCDFYLPAIARDGDVLLAVGTGGAAPGLAGMIRDAVDNALPEKIGAFAELLSSLRDKLRQREGDAAVRSHLMKRLAAPNVYERFRAEGPQAVERLYEQWIQSSR
jgi:siroheme synthase-like protein